MVGAGIEMNKIHKYSARVTKINQSKCLSNKNNSMNRHILYIFPNVGPTDSPGLDENIFTPDIDMTLKSCNVNCNSMIFS